MTWRYRTVQVQDPSPTNQKKKLPREDAFPTNKNSSFSVLIQSSFPNDFSSRLRGVWTRVSIQLGGTVSRSDDDDSHVWQSIRIVSCDSVQSGFAGVVGKSVGHLVR